MEQFIQSLREFAADPEGFVAKKNAQDKAVNIRPVNDYAEAQYESINGETPVGNVQLVVEETDTDAPEQNPDMDFSDFLSKIREVIWGNRSTNNTLLSNTDMRYPDSGVQHEYDRAGLTEDERRAVRRARNEQANQIGMGAVTALTGMPFISVKTGDDDKYQRDLASANAKLKRTNSRNSSVNVARGSW